MADTFPIIGARQELGFTPTGAVRANIDVRTGEGAVGAAIGQGAIQLTRQAIQEKKRRDEQRRRIEEKRRQMQDANSAVTANKLRDTATIEFETFKLTNSQETWEPFRIKQAADVATQIGELDFSPNAAETQRLKSEAYTSVETARSLTQATRQLRTDTIAAQTEAMVDAFRLGDATRIAEVSRRFADNGANMGKDRAEVLSDIKAAKKAGEKLRIEDEINKVHGAIELASTTGDFGIPKELAKNPIIPETKQASLRTAISAAEKARENNSKKQSELELDRSAAQVEPDWLERLRAGTLTEAGILAWEPDLTHPDSIREAVDIKEEWLKKLSRPIGTSSGYSKLIKDIDLRPQDFKASDIYAMVKPGPDGITALEAPKLVDRLERNKNPGNSFNRSLHSRYQSILTSQFKNDIIDVGGKKANVNKQNEMALALTEFANTHPDADEKDFASFYEGLTRSETGRFDFFDLVTTVSPALTVFNLVRGGTSRQRDESLINLNPTPETSKGKTKLKVGDTVERNGITFVVTRFVDGRPKVIEVE